MTLADFRLFLSVCAGLPADIEQVSALVDAQLVEVDSSQVELSAAGRSLQDDMKIQPKPLNRIKLSGTNASEVLDTMLSELN